MKILALPRRLVVFASPAPLPAALIRGIIYKVASDGNIGFGEREVRNPDT